MPPGEIGDRGFARSSICAWRSSQRRGLVEGADKLIRLLVDSAMAGSADLRRAARLLSRPGALVGKRVVIIANLKPRQMKFGLSEGMVLAAGGGERPHRVATFDDGEDAPAPGDKIS